MRITLFILTLAVFIALPFSVSAEEDEAEWDGITFELENLDGDDVTEEDVFTDGTLFLVDFWASWCRPCDMYLPHLEDMVEEFGERGFRVVIFSVDEPGNVGTARTMLLAEDYPFAILFDVEAAVQEELGVRRIPTTILFDAAGAELWRHTGYEHGDEEEVAAKIDELLTEMESEESE